MTAERLHKHMTVKVIPEKLVPQNIVPFLMDETADLPELDAFTFLNRLRALGIGASDFLNLLKGCDAPRDAVERIERNPAMNLQALIVTLNGAGLTSQDYTRMLYTARQLWEHTVTMRIESSQISASSVEGFHGAKFANAESYDAASDGEYPAYEEHNSDEENIDTYVDYDKTHGEYAAISEDSAAELPEADVYDLEMQDGSGEQAAEEYSESEPAVESGIAAEEGHIDDTTFDVDDEKDNEIGYINTQSKADFTEDTPANNAVNAKSSDQFSSPTPTTTFVAIDINELKRAMYKPAATEDHEVHEEHEQAEIVENENSEVRTPEEAEERKPPLRTPIRGGYHNGAITAAAAGAALLFALSGAVSVMDFGEREEPPALLCAENEADIFNRFYVSYNSGIIGAQVPNYVDDCTVLGDLLVEHSKGLGTFAAGDFTYVADVSGIEVYSLDGALSYVGEVKPPEDTGFLYVFEQDGSAYAVFEGECCGFMRLDGAEAAFTAVQSGTLTDIDIDVEGGSINLGSVYVPRFAESFTVHETEQYLPYLSTQKDKLSPQSITIGCDGCGFAVSAEYSLKDGKVLSEKAVMGAPIFASADGKVAAMENAVITEGTITETDKIFACAYEDGLFAALEETEGEMRVVLRGADMQPISAINNFSEQVTSLQLEDEILYVYGGSGLILAADCSDASTPKVLKLTEKTGTVKDGYAVCAERTDKGLAITAYDENGEVVSYQKLLTENERGTVEFMDSRTVIARDGKFGLAYKWFDGVSVVSEYALFGAESRVSVLYDDKTGYTAAFFDNEKLCFISAAGLYYADDPPDTPY